MKIALVRGDDWEGLYLDGKLMMENHSLQLWRVLKLLSENIKGIKEFKEVTVDEEWLEDRGHFPDNLLDVMSSQN